MARRSFTSFAVVALVVTLVTIAAAVPATPVHAERSSHGVEIAALMREVASIQSPLAVGDLYERLNNLYLALRKELLAQRASWRGQAKTLVEAVNALQAKVTKKAAFVSSLEKRINETVAKVEKAKTRVQPIQQNVDWLTGNATAVRAEIQKGDDARAAELKLFEKRIGDSKFVQSAITAVISKLDEGLKLDAKANRFPDTLSLLELEADEEAPATEVDTDAEERAVAEEQTNEVMESAAAQQPTDPMMMRFMDAVLGMSKKVTDAKALRRGLQRLHDQVGDYVADLKASEEEAYLAWDGVRRTLVADRNKLLEQRWDARAHLKALLHHVEVRTDKLAELRENRASLPAIVDNLVAQIATRRKQYTDLENAFKAEVTELRNELSTVRAMRSLVKKAMDDAMTAKF